VAALAGQAGVPLGRADAERLHRHTRGHPLYVRTLLSELTPGQLAGPDGDLPAPRSLAATTTTHLAGLPEEAQALASALAVIGHRAPLPTAGRIAGVPHPAPALESLLATGFVTWSPREAQTPVDFSHPLYRAAVYDGLTPTRRQELHRAAAAVLGPPADLAHRVAAADSADEDLANELDDAAARELASGAPAQAARYLLWASPLTLDRDLAGTRLLRAARLLLADGQTARAGTLRAQLEGCRDSPLRNLVLGTLAWEEGDAAAAESWLLRVAAVADDGGTDPGVAGPALAQLGMIYGTQARAAEATRASGRALAFPLTGPEAVQNAWFGQAFGTGLRHGAPAALSRLAGRLPQPPGEVPAADAPLLIIRGALGFYAGRHTAAVADLRAAVKLARRGPASSQLPRAHMHLAQLLLYTGEWDEALAQAHTALSLVADERRVWMEAQVHATLARVLACRGDWAGAEEHLAAAWAAATALGTVEAIGGARIAEAVLGRARGEPARAVRALGPLVSDGSQGASRMSSLGWWPTLVLALLDCGDVDGAAASTGRLAEAAGERGLDLRARITGLRAQVALAQRRPDEADAGFRQALALLGPDDPLIERAQLRHAFGRLLLARGDRRGALDQLRAAHELLERVDAVPLLAQVAGDLNRCGIRAAAPPARSPLALTDRERDVVALVSKGLTNREVAAELYLSDKAVEYHLHNVFGKLGIRSRRELRDRLRASA